MGSGSWDRQDMYLCHWFAVVELLVEVSVHHEAVRLHMCDMVTRSCQG